MFLSMMQFKKKRHSEIRHDQRFMRNRTKGTRKKFKMLNENFDFLKLKQTHRLIEGDGDDLPEEVSPSIAYFYKYCPITSVDVERIIFLTKKHIEKILTY